MINAPHACRHVHFDVGNYVWQQPFGNKRQVIAGPVPLRDRRASVQPGMDLPARHWHHVRYAKSDALRVVNGPFVFVCFSVMIPTLLALWWPDFSVVRLLPFDQFFESGQHPVTREFSTATLFLKQNSQARTRKRQPSTQSARATLTLVLVQT